MAALRLASEHALRDEDLAPQLVSWAISLSAAAAWLVVVNLTPSLPAVAERTQPVAELPTVAWHDGPASGTSASGDMTIHPAPGGRKAHTPASPLDVAGAFAAVITGQAVAKVVDLIPGVQAVQGDASANVRRGDKTALTIGAAGTTATPGMVKFGGDGRSASASTKLGEVMRGETIDRARLSVRPLPQDRSVPPTSCDAAGPGRLPRRRRRVSWQSRAVGGFHPARTAGQ